uniref:VCP-interacting membrane protein n=1 Tax=Nothobranchius korthausae TaxID=1143690 RepID=A0A1A8ELU8_9TELE
MDGVRVRDSPGPNRPLANQDPPFLSLLGEILSQYGWYLLAATIMVYFFIQHLRKRMSAGPSDSVFYSLHDTSKVARRQTAQEAAHMKMQEELNAKAAIIIEKQKQSTDEAGSSSSAAQKTKTGKKQLRRNDYSPLMGQGGDTCAWRPGRRGPSSGG